MLLDALFVRRMLSGAQVVIVGKNHGPMAGALARLQECLPCPMNGVSRQWWVDTAASCGDKYAPLRCCRGDACNTSDGDTHMAFFPRCCHHHLVVLQIRLQHHLRDNRAPVA